MKQDTNMRTSVSVRNRLEITLRFLATEETYRSLIIILLGMCNAHYQFTDINIGVNGPINDGGVYRKCNLGKSIRNNWLNFPPSKSLPGRSKEVPYVIIEDDAFPLSDRLLKPYPLRGMSHSQRIFNYRLSRARRLTKNSFGILANRFRVLLNPM
ncbi:hypothetical protein RN001_002724 [Aquatica leii]|uniref:DDE Tnp4 domain-containing protein n=1 Tax=Aquatica leii TaxID=1421715 RepID=A0AAN7SRC3_9COLE|nr:hypothetical protein RN001_002724 [Aquatica leii]